MTDNIELGPVIEVDGLPEWLRPNESVIPCWGDNYWFSHLVHADCVSGSERVTAIKLPAYHPYYTVQEYNEKHGTTFTYWPGGDEPPSDIEPGSHALLSNGLLSPQPAETYRTVRRCRWASEARTIIGYVKGRNLWERITDGTITNDRKMDPNDTITIKRGKNRHRFADLIHAWAEGAEIEYRDERSFQWREYIPFGWGHQTSYRIKTEQDVLLPQVDWAAFKDDVICVVQNENGVLWASKSEMVFHKWSGWVAKMNIPFDVTNLTSVIPGSGPTEELIVYRPGYEPKGG